MPGRNSEEVRVEMRPGVREVTFLIPSTYFPLKIKATYPGTFWVPGDLPKER